MPDTTPTTDDLPARLRAALTERYTALGNPFSRMRREEKGPDGWPAEHPVGPDLVATVLRELMADIPARLVLGTTDQQPETTPDDRRDRWEAAAHAAGREVDRNALAAYMAVADEELAAALPEFELRSDTEIRAAALNEAADYAQQVAKAMATADEDWASRAGWACASVATGLRRMADEAQQPETEAPYPTTTTWTVEAQERDGTWTEWGDHYASDKAHQLATEFRRTTPARGIRVVRQVVTTTVEPAADQPDTETEAWPPQTEWIGEVLEDDAWMYLGASPDRAVAEKRRASVTRRHPDAQTRTVRKTTTYTVATEEPTR